MADPPAGRARLDDTAVASTMAALEGLLDRIEEVPGPTAEAGLDAVATLAELYGEALARVVEIVAEPAVLAALTADELVGHLLLLHGLHPEPVADRVARAAAEASAELGGAVEVVSVSDGVARLRVAAPGCPSSAPATLDAISNVVVAAAPELIAVQPEPVRPPRPAALIPAESLLRHPAGH